MLALYGSAATSGLRPNSDLDLLVVVVRSITPAERRALVAGLLAISGRAHETRGAPRPLEVTVLAEPDINPWRYPPTRDLQFGEWLRTSFETAEAGDAGDGPAIDPDVALLIETARAGAISLVGPGVGEVLPVVPWRDVVEAIGEGVDGLLSDVDHDTSNVLLTLARMRSTLETRTILAKDEAADWLLERLAEADPTSRSLIEARDRCRAGDYEPWTASDLVEARAAASGLAATVRTLANRN